MTAYLLKLAETNQKKLTLHTILTILVNIAEPGEIADSRQTAKASDNGFQEARTNS